MTTRLTRRHLMQGLGLAWLAGPAWATAPERSLRPIGRGDDLLKKTVPDLREIVSGAGLNGPSSVAVARVETGEMLENYAGSIGLPPASVAKALTAGYALDTLGGDYRFTTRLLTTTPPTESGAITGDLILAGGGDPTLDTDGLGRLAERLKEAGVTEVRGRLLVWGGALPRIVEIDSEQPDHVGYNPAISGLNLNYNRVHFEWRRAGSDYAVTMDGRSGKYRPEVAMARMVVVARSSPIYTYRDAGLRDDWTVAKSALGDGGARWLPVREPELYAGEVFQTLAGAYGIRLKAPERIETLPQEATEVAALDSAPLLEILEDMLLYSTNLTAEITGLTASAARGVAATDLAASAAAMNTWAQEALGLEKVALVDHSGLGDMSRISAQAMVTALIALRDRLPLRAILKDIPLVDDSRAAIPDSGVEIRAKTGTLNFVSGLAGYETLADGSELAFAIFSADLQRRAEIPMEARERPQGGRTWNGKAKRMQQALLRRWRVVFAEAREQAEVQE